MRALGVVVVAAAAVLSCDDANKPREPAAPPARPDAAPAAPARAPEKPPDATPKGPAVQLLDAGAAPRQRLRYKLRPKLTEHLEADLKIKILLEILDSHRGKVTRGGDTPTMRMVFREAVDEVTPEGTALVVMELVDTSVLANRGLDQSSRALEAEIAELKALRGSVRLTERGEQLDARLEPPRASPKLVAHVGRMRNVLRDLYWPLPEEEVGVGAMWEVTMRTSMEGLAVNGKVICTVRRLGRSAAEIDYRIELSAPAQTLSLALAPGVVGKLESFEGWGGGEMTLALDRLAQTSTSKLSVNATYTLSDAAGASRAVMKMDVARSTRRGRAPRKAPRPR